MARSIFNQQGQRVGIQYNIVQNFGGAGPKKDVPPLLLYTVNRVPQSRALFVALQSHIQTNPINPAIFLLIGHQDEAHTAFAEAFATPVLADVLRMKFERPRIDPVSIPGPLLHLDLKESTSEWWRAFAEKLSGKAQSVGQMDSIDNYKSAAREALRTRPADGLLLHTWISASQWLKGSEAKFLAWLESWIGFSTPDGRTLAVIFSIEFDDPTKKGFLAKLQATCNARRIRRIRKSSERVKQLCLREIRPVVLPELRPVPLLDAVTWVRLDLPERRFDTQALQAAVHNLYASRFQALGLTNDEGLQGLFANPGLVRQDGIRMYHLGDILRRLLQKHRI